MQLNINGQLANVPPAWQTDSLLMVLREPLGLVGAKFGCGTGLCGACTVLVDGEAVRSCQWPVRQAVGRRIETIEGLAGAAGSKRGLHPVQQAWLDESVPQCGYCQSGQIMGTVALLRRVPKPTSEQVNAALAGQLCRCGTQQRVRRAVQRAAAQGAA